ncbi:Glucosamine-phosphate N-acetyltransferase-like protein [Linnemannia exigua]|uniref:Glucosamine 6-phosphate N-acetyltransferase n=1 Tax=Linnemannia exigua TaxID=604196 RepID=A0AAD4DGD5_9FUNG|nr:Glucosamine-phosphate N-acetyltransferase-like protein [Linnemannia exigua]
MSPQPPTLFSPSLISTDIQGQLPLGYKLRPLEITDYTKGFYDCLAGLTVVGKVSEQSFQQTFEQMRRCEGVYHIVVIEDLAASRIVATGTLIVEQKFLRGCAKAGHIEDIVVHDSQRGKKFGIRLIDQLKHIGTMVGCYKLLLTCSESNEAFYGKSGFVRKDLHMAVYLNNDSTTTASVAAPVVVVPVVAPTTSSEATTSTAAILGAATTMTTNNSNSIVNNNNNNNNNIPHTDTTPKVRTVSIEALSASMESIMVK